VLRKLREAMAEEEVRRRMEREDLLLRDSMLFGAGGGVSGTPCAGAAARGAGASAGAESGAAAETGRVGATADGTAARPRDPPDAWSLRRSRSMWSSVRRVLSA